MHWKTKVNVWLLCWGVLQSLHYVRKAGKKEGSREGEWGQSYAPNNWRSVTGAMIIINSGAWVPSRHKNLINHSVLPNFQLPIANSRHCLISPEGCEKPLHWPLPNFQEHLCDVHISRLPGRGLWHSFPPIRGMFRTLCLWSWISSARVLPDSVSSRHRPMHHLLCDAVPSSPTSLSMQDPTLVFTIPCAHSLIKAQHITSQLAVCCWPPGFYEILKDKPIFSSFRIPWLTFCCWQITKTVVASSCHLTVVRLRSPGGLGSFSAQGLISFTSSLPAAWVLTWRLYAHLGGSLNSGPGETRAPIRWLPALEHHLPFLTHDPLCPQRRSPRCFSDPWLLLLSPAGRLFSAFRVSAITVDLSAKPRTLTPP